MALYLLEYDYADMDARARTREAHLAYLADLRDQGTLLMAGPLGDDSGARVVFDVASVEEAQALVDADPYTPAGVGTNHRIREWRVVVSR